MATFGGKFKILGTTLLSVAIPTNGRPIILDMASKNITMGKLKMSKSLEVNWVLDEKREPTNETEESFSLVLLGGLTFGYKGFGLALIIDLFFGV